MKRILLALCIVSISGITIAQCTTTKVNASSIVKNADGDHANSGDQLWLCRNLTFEVSGDDNHAYIEFGGDIIVSGDRNNIYMKGPGDISVTGADNKITHEMSITPSNTGMTNTLTPCDSVVLDYSVAPTAKSCDVTLGVPSQKILVVDIKLYPNPAKDVVNIDYGKGFEVSSFEVYGVNGQIVLKGNLSPNTPSIDVSELEKGLYIFKIQTSGGTLSQRMNIE